MSHDQRPAKLRVVKDASSYNPARRREDEADARLSEDTSVAPAGAGARAKAGPGALAAADRKGGLVLPAMVFLLACVAGGAAFTLWRPF